MKDNLQTWSAVLGGIGVILGAVFGAYEMGEKQGSRLLPTEKKMEFDRGIAEEAQRSRALLQSVREEGFKEGQRIAQQDVPNLASLENELNRAKTEAADLASELNLTQQQLSRKEHSLEEAFSVIESLRGKIADFEEQASSKSELIDELERSRTRIMELEGRLAAVSTTTLNAVSAPNNISNCISNGERRWMVRDAAIDICGTDMTLSVLAASYTRTVLASIDGITESVRLGERKTIADTGCAIAFFNERPAANGRRYASDYEIKLLCN